MSLEHELHDLVAGLEGVAAVYIVDPLWKNVARQIGAKLGQNTEVQHDFVQLTHRTEGGAEELTVRMRIGSDGTVPAPRIARAVAAHIRRHVRSQRPGLAVIAAVEISAIAS